MEASFSAVTGIYSVQQEKLQKTTIARLLLKIVCLMFKSSILHYGNK
jgi:hypothetical protein